MEEENCGDIEAVVTDIKHKYTIVFCKSQDSYYIYSKKTGLYKKRDVNEMYRFFGKYIHTNCPYDLDWESDNFKCIYEHLKLVVPYPDKMGAEKGVIHLRNGVYLVEDKKLVNFNPQYYATSALPFVYNTEAKAPVFEKFIKDVSSSKAMEKTLCEIAGCVLSGETSHEKLIMNIGCGANGKSVFLGLLCELLGQDLVTGIPVSEINGNRAFVLHELAGKRLNALHELENGITLEKLFDSNVKRIVTNEPLNAEVKFAGRYQFKPDMNFIVNANYLPDSSDIYPSHALLRRYLVLNWNRKFKPDEQDKNILDKMKAELSGIFNLALQGLKRLQDNDFVFSAQKESDQFLEDCFKKQYPAYGFVKDCIIPSAGSRVYNDDLNRAFVQWAADHDVDLSDLKIAGRTKAIKKAIKQQGISLGTGRSDRRRWLTGIALKGESSNGKQAKKFRKKTSQSSVGDRMSKQ